MTTQHADKEPEHIQFFAEHGENSAPIKMQFVGTVAHVTYEQLYQYFRARMLDEMKADKEES